VIRAFQAVATPTAKVCAANTKGTLNGPGLMPATVLTMREGEKQYKDTF